MFILSYLHCFRFSARAAAAAAWSSVEGFAELLSRDRGAHATRPWLPSCSEDFKIICFLQNPVKAKRFIYCEILNETRRIKCHFSFYSFVFVFFFVARDVFKDRRKPATLKIMSVLRPSGSRFFKLYFYDLDENINISYFLSWHVTEYVFDLKCRKRKVFITKAI